MGIGRRDKKGEWEKITNTKNLLKKLIKKLTTEEVCMRVCVCE